MKNKNSTYKITFFQKMKEDFREFKKRILRKRFIVNIRIALNEKYNFKWKLFRKFRRIESINNKISQFKNQFMLDCYEKNRWKNIKLIKIENTKYKDIDSIIESKNMNIDSEFKNNFLELPKDFAYETWYLNDKNEINQFKIEEDWIRHWSKQIREFIIKTRPYWYIKESIRNYNILNWRWYWNYHFNDLECYEIKKVNKMLWKKLLQQPIKEMIKNIFYFWFPWEYSSQMTNRKWMTYL